MHDDNETSEDSTFYSMPSVNLDLLDTETLQTATINIQKEIEINEERKSSCMHKDNIDTDRNQLHSPRSSRFSSFLGHTKGLFQFGIRYLKGTNDISNHASEEKNTTNTLSDEYHTPNSHHLDHAAQLIENIPFRKSIFQRFGDKISNGIKNNPVMNLVKKPPDPTHVSMDSLTLHTIERLLKHRYMIWETSFAHSLLDIVTSTIYAVSLAVCIIIAIFITDIEHSFTYHDHLDETVDYILLVIFCILMVDVLLSCLVYKWYPLSFFWCLETLGTLALLVDISSIYSQKSRHQTNVFLNGKGGRTFHAARILALLRFSRIEQYIRITRLAQFAHIIHMVRAMSNRVGLGSITSEIEYKMDRLSPLVESKPDIEEKHLEYNTAKIASEVSQN
eukprot:820932_1